MSRALLITGATGKQGGATINALLASSRATNFTIIAVTRSPESVSAQKLRRKSPSVKVVKGDLNDCNAIFAATKAITPQPIWGVFSVQNPSGRGQNAEIEERQGRTLIDEALKNGVKHFVYTSVDRHGEKSFDNPTAVSHFRSKHDIEHHLTDSTSGTGMTWTILRPTTFFEAFTPGISGKLFFTAFKQQLKDRPLQFICTEDIGHFAAAAFLDPEKYRNRAISLAGDDLTPARAQQIFKEKTGEDLPETYSIFAKIVLWMVKEVSVMMKWFYNEGYKADISALREEHPGLMDFGAYLEKKSGYKMKG